MKLLHNVTLSVFIKPEEDEAKVMAGFRSLLPFDDLHKEKIVIDRGSVTGFNDRTIKTVSSRLDKERHTRAFVEYVQSSLSGAQKQQVLQQDNRLDAELFFYLRFDKEYLPRLVLTDSGDCVHVKLSIAAFPKKEGPARKIVEEIFK